MTTRLPLSVAIVCKNNAATIRRTLASVRDLASEIVAVDSGSTDATLSLIEHARSPGLEVRIVHSPWLGHIKTKQLALDTCTQPWALSIDSDESVEPELASAIARFVCDPASPRGASMNRMTYYQGTPLRYAWQPEWRLRLVRAGCGEWGGLDPHDKLSLRDEHRQAPARLPGTLRHDSFLTFAEHLKKQAQHAETMARSLHASGVRGSRLRLVISPAGAFFKQLVLKRAMLDGSPGWLAAASTAAAALMKHAVLLELSREPSDSASPTHRRDEPRRADETQSDGPGKEPPTPSR
jgi:glycosyltransferase involved in cell wall biosynthesis